MNKLSIFIINYDWRDIFRNSFIELEEKLNRDQLNPHVNDFFFFSWANHSYNMDKGRFRTVHKKTRLYKIKPLLDFFAIFYMVFVSRKCRLHPDVWLSYDFGMLPAMYIASKIFGGKVVLFVSNQPRIYSRTRRFGFIKSLYSRVSEKIWWRLADQFLTINENMKKYLIDIGVPSSLVTIFYINTIDRDLMFIEKAKGDILKKKYNLPTESKIILSVARLEAEKNCERLIELFSKLSDDFFLLFVGRGSLKSYLEEKARLLGVEKRIIFCGYVGRDEIWNYYKDSDVFILLSRAEALGLVFWEAMYVGLPVIGSMADGIIETIGKDGDRGRLWSEKLGQDGFCNMVKFCVTPSDERDLMCKRGKKFVDLQRGNRLTINDLFGNTTLK